jgi:Helix-turn-helix domain
MKKRSVRDLTAETDAADVFLTTREVADLCRRSHETVANWRQKGFGPPYELFNGRVLYRLNKVREYMRLDVQAA